MITAHLAGVILIGCGLGYGGSWAVWDATRWLRESRRPGEIENAENVLLGNIEQERKTIAVREPNPEFWHKEIAASRMLIEEYERELRELRTSVQWGG